MTDDDLEERVHRLELALKWIRFKTYLHYIGRAFEPEHMRDIANLAADALAGEQPDLPDFDQAMQAAREEGVRLAARLRELAPDPDGNTAAGSQGRRSTC